MIQFNCGGINNVFVAMLDAVKTRFLIGVITSEQLKSKVNSNDILAYT